MPSMMDTLARVDHVDPYDLSDAPPQSQGAPREFWHALAQYVRGPHAHRPRYMSHPYTVLRPRIEMPAERLARQDPFLSMQAGSGL